MIGMKRAVDEIVARIERPGDNTEELRIAAEAWLTDEVEKALADKSVVR